MLVLPAPAQTLDDQIGLRLVAVRTEAEATSLLEQIRAGQSFEEIAKAHSVDSSAKDGGYLGLFRVTDLKTDLQRAVAGLKPGQISPVTRIGGEFLILQRLSPEESNWTSSYNAGSDAFQSGRYDEAAKKFLEALPFAEKLMPAGSRLEDNLRGLAEAYRLQKKFADAEPFYLRYLALHWGGPSAPEVLDRFCSLVALSYFRDSQFAAAQENFQKALNRSPLAEELYAAMSTILFKAQLIAEADALMEQAAKLFPASREVKYRLAELYRSSYKARKALEVFESIDAAPDPAQQSLVYQKIGGIHVELAELDEAAAAYKKSLELTPGSVDARVGLGDVYLQQGRSQEALAEYNRILAKESKTAVIHYRVADANLRLGRFADAADAARKALAIDQNHHKSHFVLATALLRMGAEEEGNREFEVYRRLEAESRAETDRERSSFAANRDAAAALMDGRGEEAIEAFRAAIATAPDSVTAYFNLGIAQSKLGQHKAAVETFQKMLAQNISDSFLVSWNLAREYEQLGEAEASRGHRTVYLQNIDLALREALEANLE